MIRELAYSELRRDFSAEDLTPAAGAGLIGQPRAEEALRFGLSVKAAGYNVYVSGPSGTGKFTFAERFAKEAAAGEPTPPDMLYAYNFDEPKEPRLLKMSPGAGRRFRADLDELRSLLAAEIPKLFADKDYEGKRAHVYKGYQRMREDAMDELKRAARAQGFGLRMANGGIYFMPVVDGVTLSDEQYEQLSDDERDKLSEGSDAVQERAVEAMREIKAQERAARKEVEALDYSVALMFVGRQVGRLQEKYADEADALAFLSGLKEDVLDNIEEFNCEAEGEQDEPAQLTWIYKRGKEDQLAKLHVNLITDNHGLTGAPVATAKTLTHAQLVGEIEYDNEFGNVSTDFMKIKPGLLHKANGGYLVLQAQDVLSQPHVWEALRKALKTGEAVIEQVKENGANMVPITLKPKPAPLSVKVLLTGDPLFNALLQDYDDDYRKLFRVQAEFDDEMGGGGEHIRQTAAFIGRFAEEAGLTFQAAAVARLLEYSARLTERQGKLTTRFGELEEALVEAAGLAKGAGRGAVAEGDVTKALENRDRRQNLYEEKLTELLDEGTIMVDTDGAKIGQVNGLAVIDLGGYAFAKPTRITATTYVGQAGIINIEEEADMSGAIHTKGVQVLTGYLGQNYAQAFPLSLSARVCFEQNYSGIDGDSASSAELYAILSSLADAPVEQGVAVTGSMNQFGEIQPVGGVTYKIEGFYDTCAKRGLTGRQGVLIPAGNVKDLTLADRVANAVKDGAFHIWAADTVEDGLELLTGLSAAVTHGKAQKKLKGYFKAGMGGGKK